MNNPVFIGFVMLSVFSVVASALISYLQHKTYKLDQRLREMRGLLDRHIEHDRRTLAKTSSTDCARPATEARARYDVLRELRCLVNSD